MRDFAFRMLITILGLASCDAVAQSVISTAGNSFERSGMTITFTIGELATETCYSDNSILTQGFNQPRQRTSAVEVFPESVGQLVLYPNPTRDRISVTAVRGAEISLDIEVMNISGKKLMKFSAETDQFLIDLDRFPAGIYYLRIVDTQSDQISTHKVIKY
jgi:hypothetical protein